MMVVGGLPQLVQNLRHRHTARHEIVRLGIVAHGNLGGRVGMRPPLTHSNVDRSAADLRQLANYLRGDAFIEFYACNAAAGTNGRILLERLSRHLPGRTIVGFEIRGGVGQSGLANLAGRVNPAPQGRQIEGQYLNRLHATARWARDGMLVRDGAFSRDAQRHCGAPNCQGHGAIHHHCPGFAAQLH